MIDWLIAACCGTEMTSASGGRNRVAHHCKVPLVGLPIWVGGGRKDIWLQLLPCASKTPTSGRHDRARERRVSDVKFGLGRFNYRCRNRTSDDLTYIRAMRRRPGSFRRRQLRCQWSSAWCASGWWRASGETRTDPARAWTPQSRTCPLGYRSRCSSSNCDLATTSVRVHTTVYSSMGQTPNATANITPVRQLGKS